MYAAIINTPQYTERQKEKNALGANETRQKK